MSGRGRGRGRGGRGGGGPPQSVSQQFLLRSAQEAGFDVRNLRALGGNRSEIFPDFEWNSGMSNTTVVTKGENGTQPEKGGKVAVKQEETASKSTQQQPQQQQPTRSPKTIYLISKTREIHHHFQNSVFYVRSTKEVPDVVRYSDRLRPPPSIDAGAVLSHCLGGRKRTRCGVFVPEELVGGQRRIRGWDGSGAGGEDGVGGKGGGKKGLNLAELAAKIRKEGGLDVEENDGEGQEDEEGGVYEDEGEESEGEDYVTNYYESEGDESKGSDGEPTF